MTTSTTLLVVEDHPDQRELSTIALEQEGFAVTAASSITAARELMSSKVFDVLIADGFLPDGHVRDLFKGLPASQVPRVTVLVSGAPREEHGQLEEFRVFLLKPVDFTALRTLIRSLLGE